MAYDFMKEKDIDLENNLDVNMNSYYFVKGYHFYGCQLFIYFFILVILCQTSLRILLELQYFTFTFKFKIKYKNKIK